MILAQLTGELRKLFARKRTYIGFGAFLVVEILIVVLLQLPKPKNSIRRLIESTGYGFEEYFGGLTLGLMVLMWTTLLLASLYLALVSGDVVSKDVEEGTMRMMLCRPVSRVRIGLLKFLAGAIYTVVLMTFVAATSLVAGVLSRGAGSLFVFAPMEGVYAMYATGEGLARFAAAIPLLTLGMLSITSLGFMLSCCNVKPAAATIVTLSVFFLDSIFRNIPYFESLRGYFLTSHMGSWVHVFERYIPWTLIIQDYAYLIAIDATFVVAGLAIFKGRDFKG